MQDIYEFTVPIFIKLLGGLKEVIEKGEAHANAHKWEENTLLNWRLFPDMFVFTRYQDIIELLSITDDNIFVGTEQTLPPPSMISHRNTGAPPLVSTNPMGPGPMGPGPGSALLIRSAR